MRQLSEKGNKTDSPKKITRRQFLKLGGVGVATAVVANVAPEVSAGASPLKGKKMAMVIDLQRCTGCGACNISCKNENNVQEGIAWAYHITKTKGKFPNVRYEHIPTLCNHCEKAPCVRICPTRAMHKEDGDITTHDPEKCIGCKSCIAACPYNVISRNNKEPHSFWKSNKQLIKGCTESSSEVVKKARGKGVPYYNPDREKNLKGSGLRYKGIVEKCTFCDHRVKRGKLPYCVERCPSSARIIGDLNDPKSKVSEILGKYRPVRLREHLGTEPKVFYVRDFNPRHYKRSKGSI
jgi:molybdopterin-containing oxidoreductase family iron-sulfur binding subunit